MATSLARHPTSRAARRSRWLFRGAVLLVVAGATASVIVWFGNTGHPIKQTFSKEPATIVKPEPNVAAPPQVEAVARGFILTAVRRVHLDQAWKLVGPGIKEDLTYKEWLTGAIPVVPVTDPLLGVSYKTDYSHPTEVVLEVALSTKPTGANQQATKVFYITVRKFGNGPSARWLVDSWVPYVPVGVPRNPN